MKRMGARFEGVPDNNLFKEEIVRVFKQEDTLRQIRPDESWEYHPQQFR